MAKEFAKKFYRSKAWRLVRNKVYKDRFGICEECEGIGIEVHHIIELTPDNINDPDITLNESNLMLLCYDCHQKKHLRKREESKLLFDSDGNVYLSE